jgi:hypothetical protein
VSELQVGYVHSVPPTRQPGRQAGCILSRATLGPGKVDAAVINIADLFSPLSLSLTHEPPWLSVTILDRKKGGGDVDAYDDNNYSNNNNCNNEDECAFLTSAPDGVASFTPRSLYTRGERASGGRDWHVVGSLDVLAKRNRASSENWTPVVQPVAS